MTFFACASALSATGLSIRLESVGPHGVGALVVLMVVALGA